MSTTTHQGAEGAETMTAGTKALSARALAGMLRSRIERAAEHKSETVSLGQFFADQIHRYLTEAGHGPEHDARSGDVPADGGDPDCDRSRDWGLRARQVHLGALSKRAAGGKWFASTNGADGLARLDNGTDGMFPVRGEWHEIEFIEALVNAYRHGDLATPAPRTDGGMTAGEDANFGDAPHDLVGEIATQVLNLPWTRLGLTDPRSGHFDHDALADRHGDVQIIAEKALRDARASDAESAWPFERTRAYLLAELERLRADLHTIGEDLTGEQGKAASWLDVATGRVANVASVLASATPAQPAGAVPDGLRALLEDAFNRGFDFAEGNWHEGTEWFTWAKEKRAKEIEDIIVSHPGEQSEAGHERCEICDKPLIAGQRAMQDVELGTVHAACCGPEKEAYVKDVETGEPLGPNDPIPQGYVYEPEHPAGQSAGSGAEILVATLAEFQRRNGYHKREIEELLTEFGELLLSKVRPAPDSTRTGDEWTAEHIRNLESIGHRQDANGICRKAVDAGIAALRTLAARPAAPEAQGAKRVRHVQRGTEYEVLHRGVELQVSCLPAYLVEGERLAIYRGNDGKVWAREEGEFDDGRFVPAPPASSGQGGR